MENSNTTIIDQMENSQKQKKEEFDPSPFLKSNTAKIDDQMADLLNQKI